MKRYYFTQDCMGGVTDVESPDGDYVKVTDMYSAIRAAVNESCSCGGYNACGACRVWHELGMGDS